MGRVLIRKFDGFPIEYQSKDSSAGLLMQNAISAGLNPDDYEEQSISQNEYNSLVYEKISKPLGELSKKKKDDAAERIKNKLKLSDEDIEDLKIILGG